MYLTANVCVCLLGCSDGPFFMCWLVRLCGGCSLPVHLLVHLVVCLNVCVSVFAYSVIRLDVWWLLFVWFAAWFFARLCVCLSGGCCLFVCVVCLCVRVVVCVRDCLGVSLRACA